MADLYGMFAALNTTDAHVLEEVVYNIQKYFSTRTADIYLPEVLPYIPIGLQHPNSGVRLLVLQLINDSLTSADVVSRFISTGMLAPVLSVPNDISTAVASKSADILIKVSRYPNGLQTLISPEGPLSGLKSTNDIGAEKRIRLLNLAAGISSESLEGREAIASGGFLGSLSKFNDSRTDLLEALNLIIIFNQLLDTSHGVEFLQTSGLLGELAIKESDVDELLLADLLRLYGKLLSRDPPKSKSWNDYPFLSLLTSHLESDQQTLQEAATSAVGQAGSTQSGLKLLEKQGKIWSLLGEHIESSNQLLRNTSLYSLAVILEQRKTDEEAAESIFKQVSAAVHPNLLHKLTYFLSTPFPELRNVVFELERNIVLHIWGARLFLTTPGYLDWLLNRDTEKSTGEKTGAEWKYEIVKALTLSNPNAEPTVRSLIGHEAFEALVAYLKQGVFFQKTTAGTAIADKTK